MAETYGVVAELIGGDLDTIIEVFEDDGNYDSIIGLTSLVESYNKTARTVSQYESKVETKEVEMNDHAEWIEEMIDSSYMTEGDDRWNTARERLTTLSAEYEKYHELYVQKESELENMLEGLRIFVEAKGIEVNRDMGTKTIPISGSESKHEQSVVNPAFGETKAPKQEGNILNDVNKIVSCLSEFVKDSCRGLTFQVVDPPAYGEIPPVADIVKHIFYSISELTEDGKNKARVELQIAWNKMVNDQEFNEMYNWLYSYNILDSAELDELMDLYAVETDKRGTMVIYYEPSYMRHRAETNRPTKKIQFGNSNYG